VKYTLASLLMAILVGMVFANGPTVTLTKATLEMGFNLARELFSVKKVAGLIQANGSKAK
jgi:hypothetical protein